MKAFGIRNLRSIADTGPVELRPLTILVGKNSSGKSTFLRALPLLRQSVEVRTTGPILWYGDYVDFGSFEDSIRQNKEAEAISFSFGFDAIPATNLEYHRYRFHPPPAPLLSDLAVNAEISIKKDTNGTTYVSSCLLSFWSDTIQIQFSPAGRITGFDVNGDNLTSATSDLTLLPSARVLPVFGRKATPRLKQRQIFFYSPAPILYPAIESHLKANFFHPLTRETTIRAVASRMFLGRPNDMLTQLQEIPLGGKTFRRRIQGTTVSDPRFATLRNMLLAMHSAEILDHLDDVLAEFAAGIRYIAPVRATAERYYRAQDLAVNEIDFQGKNLAMFLRSLSSADQDSLSNWTKKHLSFSVETVGERGHVSLSLRETQEQSYYNLADIGFGFSQVLPIVVQLWSMLGRERRVGPTQRWTPPATESRLFAVEQPELHLHPSFQASLADTFAAAVSEAASQSKPITILIETHSQTLVNRIGSLVAQQRLRPKDVQVILFEKGTGDDFSSVRTAHYDERGYLTNWPYGFFEPQGQ